MVGKAVIMEMALLYNLYPKPEKPFVLCDIDGTVADGTHRLHFLSGEKKDWKAYFELMAGDRPRIEVIEQLRPYVENGHELIFVSARPDTYREETEKWLEENNVPPYTTLIMRKGGDKRPDTEVKEKMFLKFFKDSYPIEVIFDDRPRVIEMWRSHGLNVTDVGNGIDF